MNMRFGKNKGEKIENIPSKYLRWLIENINEMDYDLDRAIRNELRARGAEPRDEPPPAGRGEEAASVIRTWAAALALKFHPDRGGSNEAMRVVNEARSTLIAALRAAHLIG